MTKFTNASYNQFTLVSASRLLFTLVPLDFETRSSYVFNATVTDVAGLSAVGLVTVLVNDVNEAPVMLPQVRAHAQLAAVFHQRHTVLVNTPP